jgi:hypothetical protein
MPFACNKPDSIVLCLGTYSFRMSPLSLSSMFQSLGISYGPMLPVMILVLFTLVMLPSVIRQGARAENVAYATYCYMAQLLGILLMTAGLLPALYAVFAMQPLAEVSYLGLMLVFAIGGGVFLWHDMALRGIDAASKAVPGALFFGTWKFTGLLVTTFAGISFALRLMMAAERTEGWWILHLLMLIYGLAICWFTLSRRPSDTVVSTAPVARPVAVTQTKTVTTVTPVVPVKKTVPMKAKTKKA